MRIRLEVEYRTQWGETLAAILCQKAKNEELGEVVLPLTTTDGLNWQGETELEEACTQVVYTYRVMHNGQVKREEWNINPHRLTLPQSEVVTCKDMWRDRPNNAYRYTSAFTKAFARHYALKTINRKLTADSRPMKIVVEASEVPEGQQLVVLGNQAGLGNWQTKNAIRMVEEQPNQWSATVDTAQFSSPVEYKFFTIDTETEGIAMWENRNNRILEARHIAEGELYVMQDEPVNLSLPDWRGAGCVIPIFSLRSEKSFGVGDFGDLKRMIDWIAMTGQRVLQILPINDTTDSYTWMDSYPYNSISIYALHPMYVDLNALPKLKDATLRTSYEASRQKLNALAQIDYVKVNDAKRSYLRRLFEQEGPAMMETEAYRTFAEKNAHWLTNYAAFSYLRDKNGTANFRDWAELSAYDKDEVLKLTERTRNSAQEMAFYCFVQYLLHIQLTEASNYARNKGVVIKGDIPIGISRCSVEAWVEPHYFNMNGQAGAPPDAFSQNGQNWGFPTYNWDVMLADGCRWWIRRFRKMAEYFDAYRIDHVLGFFRIWEIPLNSVHGLLGQFSPSMPMSVEEIESFGLTWHDNFLEPYIADWTLERAFGPLTAEVRDTYLESNGYGQYKLKPEYDTQRKVEAALKAATLSGDEAEAQKATTIRDGLYSLISDVLFVPDHKDASMFHPRISAQNDCFYQTLNDADKQAFNTLYDHYFYHRHNQFWYGEAMKKLPVLTSATRMLVCAEDLGMVPDCVPWVMNDLKILTLEIQSMPKSPRHTFGQLNENPYRSVATISTHDMSTLRGWWEENWELTQKFFNESLGHAGPAPHPLPGWLAEEVVSHHLACPSMLCLLSLQDWLSIDEERRYPDPDFERINIPANPRHYWRYRMHKTIEELLADTAFTDRVRDLIRRNGR